MSTILEVTFRVQDWIAKGLASGAYERVGGVVRDAQTKQIVTWLREVPDPRVSQVLSQVGYAASMLNLAVSTMEFAVVMQRLGVIEQHLQQVQEVLLQVDRKIDLAFYANFRAALDLAVNAFTMAKPENRRVSAMQAISHFLEAEHHYIALADDQLEQGNRGADEYLLTLSLSYVAEARCYLELEELETARRRLQEGAAALRPRVQQYTNTLLTSNPAAYLHPALRGQVDLNRLTRVYQWLDPTLDENAVFESQRENLFRLVQSPHKWRDSLPAAIWDPKVDVQDKRIHQIIKRRDCEPIYARLPEAMGKIEAMIESNDRFEMYQAEVQAIHQLEMSFHDWLQLAPSADTEHNGSDLMYIIPPKPVEIELAA
jgi:hypothetical protein